MGPPPSALQGRLLPENGNDRFPLQLHIQVASICLNALLEFPGIDEAILPYKTTRAASCSFNISQAFVSYINHMYYFVDPAPPHVHTIGTRIQ